MNLANWGNYPCVESRVHRFRDEDELRQILNAGLPAAIAYGNGRSYGDSALNNDVIHARPFHCFLDFDSASGVLHCQSGVLLEEIIRFFLPRGYFPEITPGTKYITVGGAIAADVHGKNHHVAGAFSESVVELNLMLPDGSFVSCSATDNTDLFRATCGGMGLTGVITDAKIRLKPVTSAWIKQKTLRTRNLGETFQAFEENAGSTYSVAWTDCLSGGASLGRSVIMLGEHAGEGGLALREKRQIAIPFHLPSFVLNKFSVRVFNALYYAKNSPRAGRIYFDDFFYPLDSLSHWNRLYGKNGFCQYQFVLPEESALPGLTAVLSMIARSGKGSFLSVLKKMGGANSNYLSFPMAGYTLALDFKVEPGLFSFFDKLDRVVVDHGGRFYLAKDARVSRAVFESGYPAIEHFRQLRERFGMNRFFNSMQSQRLGL